jgi:hypothetical protein
MWISQEFLSCLRALHAYYQHYRCQEFLMLASTIAVEVECCVSTMRNSYHAVEIGAVAELETNHLHQNLAQSSVAMLPVLSLSNSKNSY